ncbi:MAG TPA: lysozyme inhibitor LprI family protein [Leptospiraceae bacterium]|nr:lysozyme inhibitor LprI family protein [Leptospiraceae bacterium]
MMIKLIFTTAVFLFLGGSVSAGDQKVHSCSKISDEKKQASCWKAEYEKADKELNKVYKSLQTSLASAKAEEMKKDSRVWIDHKEALCSGQSGMSNDSKAVYYECLQSITSNRTRFLKEAFGGEGTDNKIEGSYSDSLGGSLTIQKASKNYKFTLEVVRGVTTHTGEVSGEIALKNNAAMYEEKEKDGNEPCKISFKFSDRKVIVDEIECSSYHGASAYFGGTYYKVRKR